MAELDTSIAFTDEQAMLLETAVVFCREKSPIRSVRNLLLSDTGFDRAVWDEMVALGWSGIAIPARHGGSGLSIAEVATIAEPMGRHLLASPFASTQLCIQGLLSGGGAALQASALPRIAQGAIATVALFEGEGDWDLCHITASGTRRGNAVILDGGKTLVTDAGDAEFILVSVCVDGAPALALLDPVPTGRLRPEIVIDETRRSSALDLTGLEIPAASLITGMAAQAALSAIRNAALLLATAEAAGGIAGVLDVTVDYLNTRSTFGRKIGSYQSLKHTCAEILVGLERTRSHLYHAATLCAGNRDAEIALRMAKAEAGDAFVHAGDRAVQFHGGFGFTYECDAQLFLRRALWLQYSFGDAQHQRRKLADLLLS
jgi:alkylation response protein AidB-like acyl-CoA dehydrogenase